MREWISHAFACIGHAAVTTSLWMDMRGAVTFRQAWSALDAFATVANAHPEETAAEILRCAQANEPRTWRQLLAKHAAGGSR